MRVWRAARSFDPQKGAARSWLYTILRNCALSTFATRAASFDDEKIEDAAPATESAMSLLPESNALRRCLEQPRTRAARGRGALYVHGLSHGELAESSAALGTIKSWVRRSLISLQECMG